MSPRRPVWLFLLTVLCSSAPVMADSFLAYTNRTYLPVSFEYPADWETEPSSGSTEHYSQVQVYAPKAAEDELRTYLVVRAIPPKNLGGRYDNLEEMVRTYRETLLSSMRIEGERKIDVLGRSAVLLELGGTLRTSWEAAPEPKRVPVKGQRVFFEHDGLLYQVSWLTSPERAGKVEAIFSRLLSSLTPIPE